MDFVLEKAISIVKRVKDNLHALSKKQTTISEFVLRHPKFVATHAAKDVGHETGTSETTVIRFCYDIGLKGYTDLQKEITQDLFEENNSVSSLGNYLSSKKELMIEDRLVKNTMYKDIQRIDKIVSTVDDADYKMVAKKMHQASHIYIIGSGASKISADWLGFTLNILRPNITILTNETVNLIRTFQEMTEDALLIVISQHRYVKQPIQIAKYMKEKGMMVVGITDSHIAPIHDVATVTFTLEQYETSTLDLMPALTSFLNALVTGMVSYAPETYAAQRVNFDDSHPDFIEDHWS